MSSFDMVLRDLERCERFENVVSFVGEDASGSFGIHAHHAYIITTLVYGMARFLTAGASWQYVALPGAVLRFEHDTLTLTARRYARAGDPLQVADVLRNQLRTDENETRATRESLRRIQDALLERLWAIRE